MKRSQNESRNLGAYLRKARDDKQMSLREVEATTEKEVSNAYLSQLENGKITSPSPRILYALSIALDVEYQTLMMRAGYLVTSAGKKSSTNYAIENLTSDEEVELLRYLKYYRTTRLTKR